MNQLLGNIRYYSALLIKHMFVFRHILWIELFREIEIITK
jgi:hypothetical protein